MLKLISSEKWSGGLSVLRPDSNYFKNAIEGDRNVNQRSLQSGTLQALQPVNYFGNHPTEEKGNFIRGLFNYFIVNHHFSYE